MRYRYYDVYPQQFEEVVVSICKHILGPGAQGFASGPDGGRDAKFVGVANEFPSRAKPLSGRVIVQAKHTSSPIAKFSDLDFSGPSATSVLSEEMPRIKNLVVLGEIDHYLLFANRRLPADANRSICERIQAECGAINVHLICTNAIDSMLKQFPLAADGLEHLAYDMPLRASPDELADVILALHDMWESVRPATKRKQTVEERVKFLAKNKVNGVSPEYAEVIVDYLVDFDLVRSFLADPVNVRANEKYRDAADEFAAKLAAFRRDYISFDRMLNALFDVLVERDPDLRRNKRLSRTVLYFMYWSCDIGSASEVSNAST